MKDYKQSGSSFKVIAPKRSQHTIVLPINSFPVTAMPLEVAGIPEP